MNMILYFVFIKTQFYSYFRFVLCQYFVAGLLVCFPDMCKVTFLILHCVRVVVVPEEGFNY